MKKLYFRSVIFAQIGIALCIFISFKASSPLSDIGEMFSKIALYPLFFESWYDYYYALAGYFASALIWGAVLALIIFVIYKFNKAPLPKQSWKVISYPQKVLICELLGMVIFFVYYFLNKNEIEQGLDMGELMLISAAIIMAISFLTAVFYHLGQNFWHKNRIAALVFTVFAFALFAASHVTFFYFINEDIGEQSVYHYQGSSSNDTAEMPVIQDIDEVDDPEPVYEWHGPTRSKEFMESSFKLIFGDSLAYANMYSVLSGASDALLLDNPNFIHTYIRKTPGKEVIFMNDIGLYINRNGKSLLDFYYNFSDMIYKYIPYNKFVKQGGQEYLNLLLRTYDNCSYGSELLHDLMVDIYHKMTEGTENKNYSMAFEHYEDINKLLLDYNIEGHQQEKEEYGESEIVWAYSFWARRYHEGNHNAVYEILYNINQYYGYNEDEEYDDE